MPYHAYIDDSASDQGDQRLYLAGYLNSQAAWALFTEAWREELAATPSIDYLKMSEANACVGQFAGWNLTARDEKVRGLIRVIRHFKPLSFEVSVSRADFFRHLKPVAPRGLANPHFICCIGILFSVTRHVAGATDKMPVAFTFDAQTGVSDDLALLLDYMKQSLPQKARALILGSPVFGDDRQYLPLQAADMLAWHVRREQESGARGTLPAANQLRCERGHLFSEINETIIQSWAEDFRQRPAIAEMQGPKQWRNLKGEVERQLSLGYIPPHGTRWKNAMYGARDRLKKLLRPRGAASPNKPST